MVFSLYNPAIVYGNLELAPPIELQLVRTESSHLVLRRELNPPLHSYYLKFIGSGIFEDIKNICLEKLVFSQKVQHQSELGTVVEVDPTNVFM